MDLQRQVDVLEAAIIRLGVRIVEEALPEEAQVDGGLCTVDGNRVVYLAAAAPPWRRVEILVDALRRLPHQDLWLPPGVRKLLHDQDFAGSKGGLVASSEQTSHHEKTEENDR